MKTGQTVTDDAFGNGIVRGTVPLEKSEGLNIVIDWLGRKDATKPKSGKSRGAQLSNGGFPRTVPAPPGALTSSISLQANHTKADVYLYYRT